MILSEYVRETSAAGDASLRLIYGGDVKPMNTDLIPDWQNFDNFFKNPPYNTINGVHYGISLQWGPNTLLYNTTKVAGTPTSWETIYNPKYKGQVTVPDNPIQIADAALYLPFALITGLNAPLVVLVAVAAWSCRPTARRLRWACSRLL